MKTRTIQTILAGGTLALCLGACTAEATVAPAGDGTEATSAEFEAIENEAEQAAEKIDANNAEAEFEKLKSEMGGK